MKKCLGNSACKDQITAQLADDNVMDEHKALLLEFSGSALRVEDVLEDSDPTELWTAAPASLSVESDDAELRAALQARAESDEEEADARSAAPAPRLKFFARISKVPFE